MASRFRDRTVSEHMARIRPLYTNFKLKQMSLMRRKDGTGGGHRGRLVKWVAPVSAKRQRKD
uniref:Uncharacterized protein n=1 Tax=Aegilops tauschii TaxID=37682 RepID=N1R2M0_AEGTA